jgi:hypothetical protein
MWPENEATMPGLYFCARTVLGIAGSAIPNESLHSKAGLICSKLRSSLAPENLEFLTLARKLAENMVESAVRVSSVRADPLLEDYRYVDADEVHDAMAELFDTAPSPTSEEDYGDVIEIASSDDEEGAGGMRAGAGANAGAGGLV